MKTLAKALGLLMVFAFLVGSSLGYAQDAKTYIHPRATALMPTIKDEASKYLPEAPEPWYFAGLIEHESCISLKHSRCWSPTSELKTHREQGLGLTQLTRTWNPDGSVRFDTLADLKRANPRDLGELDWGTLRDRPDLQIRGMLMLTKQNLRGLMGVTDPAERMKFADSAYNGGLTNVTRSRRTCGMTAGCDPQLWFDHTEKYNQKSRSALYGQRSAFDINNHHVRDVFQLRMPKFKQFFPVEVPPEMVKPISTKPEPPPPAKVEVKPEPEPKAEPVVVHPVVPDPIVVLPTPVPVPDIPLASHTAPEPVQSKGGVLTWFRSLFGSSKG